MKVRIPQLSEHWTLEVDTDDINDSVYTCHLWAASHGVSRQTTHLQVVNDESRGLLELLEAECWEELKAACEADEARRDASVDEPVDMLNTPLDTKETPDDPR